MLAETKLNRGGADEVHVSASFSQVIEAFAAAQAARKVLRLLDVLESAFAAAQAARKRRISKTPQPDKFAAAQAARKFVRAVEKLHVSFAAAQVARKYTEED